MNLPAKCSKCGKKFDLRVNKKDENSSFVKLINKRFGKGKLYCPKCEKH